MEQRQLGDSGLFSSAIGFGTWEMSTTMYGHIDVKEASDAVNAAIDHGITLFDTAEVYGPYHSEVLLAKALGDRRKEIVLVSKVGFEYDENGKTLGRNSQYDQRYRTRGRLSPQIRDRLLGSAAYPLARSRYAIRRTHESAGKVEAGWKDSSLRSVELYARYDG